MYARAFVYACGYVGVVMHVLWVFMCVCMHVRTCVYVFVCGKYDTVKLKS